MVILKNNTIQLEIDEKIGTVTGVTAAKTGWRLLDRPKLGLSFRLMVPLPVRRNNQVFGENKNFPHLKRRMEPSPFCCAGASLSPSTAARMHGHIIYVVYYSTSSIKKRY